MNLNKSTRRIIGLLAITTAILLLVLVGVRFLRDDEAGTPRLSDPPDRRELLDNAGLHRPTGKESHSADRAAKSPDPAISSPAPRNALFGIVMDSTGSPVPSAHLTLEEQVERKQIDDVAAQASWDAPTQQLRHWETSSDARGRFAFPPPPPDIEGRFILITEMGEAQVVNPRLRLPRDRELRVVIHRSAMLRGLVVTVDHTRGIPRAEVHGLLLNDKEPGGTLLHTTSSDDGSFALPLPQPNDDKTVLVNVRARAKGYAPSETMGASIREGEVTHAFLLVPMPTGRRLTLNLVDR